MGRQVQRQESGMQYLEHHHHLGCMWGILHMLDYHQWHNLKRRLPYKKHGRGRHFRCMGTPKTNSFNFDIDEHQQLMESEDGLFLVEQHDESISIDTCKEENHDHCTSLGFSEKSWLKENPIIFLHKGTDISSSILHTPVPEKFADSEELKKQSLHDHVLEIYKVNKEIFEKSRKYPDVGPEGNLHGKAKNAKFTKSGSFPVADSRIRSSMRRTLQHKQSEVWSLPKEDRFLKGTQMPNLTSSRSIKDCYVDSIPFEANGNICSAIIDQETRLSQGWTRLFRNHFKHIKLRIKNALKDSKKKNHSDKPTISSQSDGFEHDHRRGSMKRTSSIDESMERYVWLFDYSLSREAKWHQPQSLKLTSECKLPSRRPCVNSDRRNSSLSDLDYLCSSLTEVSHDAHIPIKTITGYCKEDGPSDSAVEPMSQRNMVQGDVETECQAELKLDRNKDEEEVADVHCKSENITELKISESNLHENEFCFEINFSKELTQSIPLSVVETHSPDDITSFKELPDSQDSVIKEISTKMDEVDCSADLQNRPDIDSAPDPPSVNKIVDNHLFHSKVEKEHEADFNYVRDVLEFSGFIGYEHLDAWHSVDHPLNPSLFKDLEALLYGGDETVGNCDHHLLFDLVNEVLLDMYEVSLSYFPKTMSCNSRARPLPTGQRLVEEVWRRIGHYLNLRPELDDSLDCVVSRDLGRGGWMNLQLETDCITLELEELMFDELLAEVYSCQD